MTSCGKILITQSHGGVKIVNIGNYFITSKFLTNKMLQL